MERIGQEDTLRFAILFGDNEAKNFTTNLKKMIELVMYQSHPRPMTVDEILTRIKVSYKMEFANKEIKVILTKNKKGTFYTKEDKFCLTPERYQHIARIYEEKSLSVHIQEFYKINNCQNIWTIEKVEELINRFIYNQFLSDYNTLATLIDPHNKIVSIDLTGESYSEEEKEILNDFINWDKNEKNNLLFELISSCLQFCMMTARKDNDLSKTLFNGKIFYMDSNIIFRLAGFNKSERKSAMENFIRKCKECGVELKYTNFTKAEIDETLENAVKGWEWEFKGEELLHPDAMKRIGIKNLDLYELFYDWTLDINNRYDDYKGFLKYLKRIVANLLAAFVKEDVESYNNLKDGEQFRHYQNELSVFLNQKERSKAKGQKALSVDVENYMYILSEIKQDSCDNLRDKKIFFISADHSYIDWTRTIMPGAIPTFFLPSMWYSLMLTYNGRATEDDYSTFCQFLKLRPIIHHDETAETRRKIGRHIMSLNESAKIKEEIIFDMDSRIEMLEADIDDDKIDAFVETSYRSITEKKVTEAVLEAQERSDRIIKDVELEASKSYNVGVAAGIAQAREEYAENRLINKAERNKKIKIVLGLFCVIIIVFVLTWLYKNREEAAKDMLEFLMNNFITACVTSILAIIGGVTALLLPTDIEKIKKKSRY